MCSISWIVREEGYELVFNRDEKWSRAKSLDVKFETRHKVPGFCARDAQGNGTWLFTNEAGITLALFNAYPDNAAPQPGKQTRGQIPLLAGEVNGSEELVQLLQSQRYLDYAPFDLLLLDDLSVRNFGWDGSEFRKKVMEPLPFFSSSSVNSRRVVAARKKRFEQIQHLPLTEIMNDTDSVRLEEAIYVTREDGGTVSQTIVRVSNETLQFSVARRGESHRFETVSRRLAIL